MNAQPHPTVTDPELGFRRLDPLPAADELAAFYESRYYDLIRRGGRAPEIGRLLAGGETAAREREWLAATLYADLVDGLETHGAGGGRVLDIGAGTGDLVAHLQSAGLRASGIEPSQDASRLARERWLDVAAATVEQWAADPAHRGAYAGAVLINVLEHVPQPQALLATIGTLLAPGGVLCVRVPNDFSDWQAAAAAACGHDGWWVAAPDHIHYFSHDSLARTLAACGFEPVQLTTDFPMEFFLLMGEDYVADPALGPGLHERRRRFELALPAALRRRLYAAFASVGAGRNTLAFAVRRP